MRSFLVTSRVRAVRSYVSAALVVLLLAPPVLAHPAVEERLVLLNQQIQQTPADPQLYLRRGDVHVEHQDWEAAKKDFAKAQELAPEDSQPLYHEAQLEFARKRWSEANELVTQFIAKNPTAADALVLRARTAFELHNYLGAADDFDAAIAATNDPIPDLYYERAHILRLAGSQYYPRVIAGLQAGISQSGPLVTLLGPLIEVQTAAGQHHDALQNIEKLPEAIRTNPQWITQRADILRAAGQGQQAQAEYRRALQAIEYLPARRRSAAANQSLEQSLRERLK